MKIETKYDIGDIVKYHYSRFEYRSKIIGILILDNIDIHYIVNIGHSDGTDLRIEEEHIIGKV